MFTTLIITLICTSVLSFAAWNYADSFNPFSGVAAVLGVISSIIALSCGTVLLFQSYSWYAAEYQAKIINREYNTQYTQEEIFYASNVIETIRDIQRTRNEITLNVNTAKKEK